MEFGLHGTFLVRHLIVFIAFNTSFECIVNGTIHTKGVIGFDLSLIELCSHLVSIEHGLLFAYLGHSQIHKFVVGFGLFSSCCELCEIRLQ